MNIIFLTEHSQICGTKVGTTYPVSPIKNGVKALDRIDIKGTISKIHDNVLPCDQCPKTFDTKRKLQYHLQTVHVAKLFQCAHCDKRFKHRAQLRVHTVSVHENDRNFKCLFCSFSSSTKGNLVRVENSFHAIFPKNYS